MIPIQRAALPSGCPPHLARSSARTPAAVKRYLAFALLAITACDSSTAPETPPPPPEPVAAAPLSQAALLGHLNVLAADSLYGRSGGSMYELMAAHYLRDEFLAYGLDPGTPDWLQTFDMAQGTMTSRNVLAVLPGQGALADQWVILGAHYDHVGPRSQPPPATDTIYNGADDNASGTALMLEIARYLSDHVAGHNMGNADRRSIMFQAYGSEERGKIGSWYFCANPTVPMANVVAMLNLDMVGRLHNRGSLSRATPPHATTVPSADTLTLVGLMSSPDWLAMINEVNDDSLNFITDESLMRRSDQACFYDYHKPVLFLHTGVHAQYHQPSDEVSLIDEAGMTMVGDLALGLLLQLVVRPTAPVFTGR